MKHQHTHYTRQDDLLDSAEFTLTHGQTGDGEAALQREIDRRNSDCARKQTDWLERDTRMIQGAIDGRGLIEERAQNYGAAAMSDRELLAALIGDTAAGTILETARSLRALRRWSIDELAQVGRIAREQALALFALLEAGARSTQDEEAPESLDTCDKVYNLMRHECDALNVEKMFVLCLDRKNRIMRKVEVTKGTATNSLCHSREMFRTAIHVGATAIIAVHNHPSGDPAPSRADIHVTRQLREAAQVIGIELIDHIIVGQRSKDPNRLGYYSFNDAGLV